MQPSPPILVAEDDDDDFFFLRRAVRQAGLENPLLRFRDGAELTRFLENLPAEASPSEQNPWMLLLDITMPVMNGFEVLSWLRTHHRGATLRPFMLSASYRPDDIERALGLGAIEYLVKPVAPALLAALAVSEDVPTPST
jgi:CheY-like chemotaxis protein